MAVRMRGRKLGIMARSSAPMASRHPGTWLQISPRESDTSWVITDPSSQVTDVVCSCQLAMIHFFFLIRTNLGQGKGKSRGKWETSFLDSSVQKGDFRSLWLGPTELHITKPLTGALRLNRFSDIEPYSYMIFICCPAW